MIGIDAAGLVLAILPIVVQIVGWYDMRVSGRDAKHLAESLENNRKIFLNSIEFLLRSAVPAAQVKALLDNPEGAAWSEESLQQRVSDHLGDEADHILEKIEIIYKTVVKLQEKLPVSLRRPESTILADERP